MIKKLMFIGLMVMVLVPSLSLAAFDVSLKYGARGEAVEELQDFLQDQGLYNGKLDGKFGLGTRKAVMAFQTANNLKADGYFGKLSRARAEELLNLSLSNETEIEETGGVNAPVIQLDPNTKALTDKINTLNQQIEGLSGALNQLKTPTPVPAPQVSVPLPTAPVSISPIQPARWFSVNEQDAVQGVLHLAYETDGKAFIDFPYSQLKSNTQIKITMDSGNVYTMDPVSKKVFIPELNPDMTPGLIYGGYIERRWTIELTLQDSTFGKITGIITDRSNINIQKQP